MTQGQQGSPSQQALAILRNGNEHFVSGVVFYPPIGADRRNEVVSGGQHPYAVILGCSDSRVPLEVLFNAGIGDIFVVRVAGNVCATDEIASIEYAVGHLGVPLCVVLGHSHCIAVTNVLTGADVGGSIPLLSAPIVPVVERVRRDHPGVPPEELVAQAVLANVWQGIENLLHGSATVRAAVSAGQAEVVGAVYDLLSGRVEWLGTHPQQEQLLQGGAEAGTIRAEVTQEDEGN